MKKKIVFFHANYIYDTNAEMRNILKKYDIHGMRYITEDSPNEYESPKLRVIDMPYFQHAIFCIRESCAELNPGDVVVFSSITDISPRPADAMELLEELHEQGLTIYIQAFSLDRPYDTYRDKIRKEFTKANAIKKRQIATKYPIPLLEYAASLRFGLPHVSYREITEHTGIPANTLINYMKRTYGTLSNWKYGTREITDKEIENIRKLKEEN